MDNLIGSYKVTYDGTEAGQLEISKNGIYFVFTFTGSTFFSDILRLVCFCGETPVPIGIPVPDGSRLSLKKQVSKSQLASQGLSTIDKCVLFPASVRFSSEKKSETAAVNTSPKAEEAEWIADYEPWLLFEDEDLKSACFALKGALKQSCFDCTKLAVPVSSSEPFPMMPVFCFGEAQIINGRQYVVFVIKNGQLV